MLKFALIAPALLAIPLLTGAAVSAPAPSPLFGKAFASANYSRMPQAVKPPRARLAQAFSCGTNERPTIACSCEARDSNDACLQESCETICVNTSETGAPDPNN